MLISLVIMVVNLCRFLLEKKVFYNSMNKYNYLRNLNR